MTNLQIKERFLPSWVTYLLHIIGILGIVLIYNSEFEKESNRYVLLIGLLVFYISLLFLFTLKLVIKITDSNIQYKLLPWQSKFKTIQKEDIKSICVRKISAIKEFGGLGIRYRNGYVAYVLVDKFGLDIQFLNKKILLSISDEKEITAFLQQNGYIK